MSYCIIVGLVEDLGGYFFGNFRDNLKRPAIL